MTETGIEEASAPEARAWDVVVFGATGFAGRLVAEVLAERYPEGSGVRWAIAGRNADKLGALKARLMRDFPDAGDVGVIVADSADRDSLAAMARQTTVVCTTVGPYARYGTLLVEVCIEEGADYCDLTGEVQWVRRMVDTYHAEAEAKGVRIVHCCGFDSIPSDIGTLMMHLAAQERFGTTCERVNMYMVGASGGFSGGTVASLLNVFSEVEKDRSLLKVLGHPYSLNPEGERRGPDGSDQYGSRFAKDLGAWTGPFLMAPVNTRIVRRSNALLGYAYGEQFRYWESLSFGKGVKGWVLSNLFAAGYALLFGGLVVPLVRTFLERFVVPKPGEGPSEEQIANGYFEAHFYAHVPGQAAPLFGRVRGHRDPGYGATATMLTESALCLALDRDKLESKGGVLTPASAMGDHLLKRLRAAGMVFEVR